MAELTLSRHCEVEDHANCDGWAYGVSDLVIADLCECHCHAETKEASR